MQNNINQEGGMFNLTIEGAARDLLQTAATWARIIAIVAFISVGISLLSVIMLPSEVGAAAKGITILFSVLINLVIVAINIFLFRFATNTLESLNNMSQVQFNEGINSLRIYFKIIGILIIIGISLLLLLFLFAGLGAALKS